jgi:hypothetical protein
MTGTPLRFHARLRGEIMGSPCCGNVRESQSLIPVLIKKYLVGGGASLPPAQLSEATLDTLDTASALHAATVGLNPTPGNQRSR